MLEACRRNNPDLLAEVLAATKPHSSSQTQDDAVAELLNETRDSWGRAALHVAAGAGSCGCPFTPLFPSVHAGETASCSN